MRILIGIHRRFLLTLAVGLCLLGWSGDVRALDAGEAELLRLRALRRDALRSSALKSLDQQHSQPFGLLVIPVDFADVRLPESWDPGAELGSRLFGEKGETLQNYFRIASGGRLELRSALAPLVRLDGTRRDYKDLPYAGYGRSRAMATEALNRVAELGFAFRALDLDGPDGLPASGDDDGQVDGVLLLHAGIGMEFDLEAGVIPAQQFYLEDPVIAGGVSAHFYAVASQGGGIGIWAHETGHLLGLDDRYDRRYPSESGAETLSRGGLGRFSLMSAGAWGTGDGYSPAMPDAYSCWQLGWLNARTVGSAGPESVHLTAGAAGGEAIRIWTAGRPDTEFFLAETRDPAAAAPFDGALTPGQLLVYHVDESLPERYLIEEDDGDWHLRVRLVEADADRLLETGIDSGSLSDLYPGTTGKTELGPASVPASDGYGGPTPVRLSQITSRTDGVSLVAECGAQIAAELSFAWTGSEPIELELKLRPTGPDFVAPTVRIEVHPVAPWGFFDGAVGIVTVNLERQEDGSWSPAETVVWLPDADVPAGAVTKFVITVMDGTWTGRPIERDWVWSSAASVLDFGISWPGAWLPVVYPGGNSETTWTRWESAPHLRADGAPVLACVDRIFADSSAWPYVRYNNSAHATLTSGQLGPEIRAVRIVHAIETPMLVADTAADGGRVVWIGPDGVEVPAVPVDGWNSILANDAWNPLHGQGVFAADTLAVEDGLPVWSVDVLPVPDAGSGPWRLRLEFAGNTSGYRKGWFIASLEPLGEPPPRSAFPLSWDGSESGAGLQWERPTLAGSEEGTRIQIATGAGPWFEDLCEVPAPARSLARAEVLELLPAASVRERVLLRAICRGPMGPVASRPVSLYPDGAPALGPNLESVWPNPVAGGGVRLMAEVPGDRPARLAIYDLRGRQIRDWDLLPGTHYLLWEGTDGAGRRAAAGTYILRLEGSGAVKTRKVVLLH